MSREEKNIYFFSRYSAEFADRTQGFTGELQ
jgi:hypothetical protein